MKNKADIKNGWSLETIYEIIGDLVCFEFILKIKTSKSQSLMLMLVKFSNSFKTHRLLVSRKKFHY